MSNRIENVLKIGKGIHERYIGTVTTDILKEITQVFTAEPNPKNNCHEVEELEGVGGYQRRATPARQNKFADYLKSNPDKYVVPAVFLNGRGKWKFNPYNPDKNSNFGYIEITDRANIMDGQHRCGGFIRLFAKSAIQRDCEFVVYKHIPLEDEVTFFDTINTTQKGVPTSLSVFNLQNEWFKVLAKKFATDESSPMKGLISLTGTMQPQHRINLAAAAKNIQRTFSSAAFEEASEDDRFEFLCEVWHIIKQTFPDEWEVEGKRKDMQYKLLELTGVIAWSLAFNRNLGHYYDQEDGSIKSRKLAKAIEKTINIDWKKDGEFVGLTGEVGGRKIADRIEVNMQND